ncbi:glutamate/tyrosine decarboxylase-like PLP-dependent enzyme [Hydrogenispora ethanolica]|uniref:Glutamate/tyrosine decarboxylase-like PLP-dependent enzyme n=1 Tax=Hydrogenispora ethanolica TaxID=1082276 RepID=A0A4R1RQH2_HYDET|nr:pyridoxal-dependent decarboxylase [Hydrogenispora ethanolica]TCL68556.1 glutamate/tyrosine decarboxylase-like PLP-dependent enzyme [Hydrogenispora ethanolica]
MSQQRNSAVCDRLREEAADGELFEQAKEYAVSYMCQILDQPVFPGPGAIDGLDVFREPLPVHSGDPYEILGRLHHYGSPATVAQTGGRYFGFVNGGIIPVSLAAKWLSDAWDQNAALSIMSPVVSVLEEVCENWLVDLFHLPKGTAAGFVGGSSTAMLCGLTAGRNHLLEQLGYDVSKKGLFGAPEIRVIVGAGAHSSVFKALAILGLGSERIVKIPEDDQGRMVAAALPELDSRTLLIVQAGNVNTGSFDDFQTICPKARAAGAWVHVDGAFGLWAAASARLNCLTKGVESASSWSLDAHKTLNAPYDNGIIMCSNRETLTKALHMAGSYIIYSDHRDGMLYTPDMSRRARAVELWAALKSLGRNGVSELVDDLHDKAVYFGEQLKQHHFVIHNEIAFNQVLVSTGNPDITAKTLKNIQASGICWGGGATWRNDPVIRISVCSYRTTYEDIDRSVAAFVLARKIATDRR